MEIHHQSVPEPRPSQGSKDWPRIDVTRGNRAAIHRATEKALEDQRETDPSEARSDRLELSQEARRLAEQADLGKEPTEAELERVRELRAQYESGELNTYERVQRAAGRMLGEG
jgi:anti-sigma28 factor (negative regulator of flagellin synthesis)